MVHLIVYDTAEESVFPVSGTLGCVCIVMERVALYNGVMEFADNMGAISLEVIPSPGWLT